MLWRFTRFAPGRCRLLRLGFDGAGFRHELMAEQPIACAALRIGAATAWWDEYGWARRCAANGG